MSLSRKVDYAALEREFVTAPESQPVSRRTLAKREGISNSTLSDYAKKHNWEGRRQQFLDQVDEEFIRISALKRGRKLAELAELSVDVLEGMLVRAAEQLNPQPAEDGTASMFKPLELSPRDVLDVVRQIAVARGDPSVIVGEKNVTVHTVDPRLISALGELAGRALTGRSESGRPARSADLLALPGGAAGAEGSPAEADSA